MSAPRSSSVCVSACVPHLGLLVCRLVCVCACARASACGRACIGTAVCECVRACIGTAADSLDLQGARNAPCNLVLTHLGLLVCRGVCVCVCVCMCELCVCVCFGAIDGQSVRDRVCWWLALQNHCPFGHDGHLRGCLSPNLFAIGARTGFSSVCVHCPCGQDGWSHRAGCG